MGARNTYAAAAAHPPPLVPATVAAHQAIQEAKESARQAYQATKSDLQEEFSTKFADLGAKLDTVLERTQVTDVVLFDRAQDGTVVNRLDTFSEMAVALNTGSVILHEGLGQLHRNQRSMQALQEQQCAVQEAPAVLALVKEEAASAAVLAWESAATLVGEVLPVLAR